MPVVDFGPYIGMRDALDPSASSTDRANLLQNVYPLDAELGEGIVGRPGFSVLGGQSPAGAAAVQAHAQFTKLAGTEYTVRICGGRFETYNWSLGSWSETLTAGNLSTASVTLSATARVALVPFADRLIVSDGINTPWSWDGTSGGGITKLTNAPVFFGPPTVYAAKLFGIKASDRTTMVWSEEFDETIGYEATVGPITYANRWKLGQTDQNALVGLRGTNTALFYWRERSAGAVFGKVAADFSTTATHDALTTASGTGVGTKSPWAILAHGEGFLFPDADGKPHRCELGSGITPVWADFRETLASIPRGTLSAALAIDYLPARLLLIGLTETAQQYPSMWLVYRDTGAEWIAAGIWRGFLSTSAAMVKDAQGVPTWLHGSSDGYTYAHGNPDGTIWDDGFVSGTVAISHVVQAMPMGADTSLKKAFTRLDLVTRSTSVMHLSVDYDTPGSTFGTALSLTVQAPAAAGSYWDVASYDTASWMEGASEVHSAVSWRNAHGRWVRPRITHSTAGERFGFIRWRPTARSAGNTPSTP